MEISTLEFVVFQIPLVFQLLLFAPRNFALFILFRYKYKAFQGHCFSVSLYSFLFLHCDFKSYNAVMFLLYTLRSDIKFDFLSSIYTHFITLLICIHLYNPKPELRFEDYGSCITLTIIDKRIQMSNQKHGVSVLKKPLPLDESSAHFDHKLYLNE